MSNETKYTFSLYVSGIKLNEINPLDSAKLMESLCKMLGSKHLFWDGIKEGSADYAVKFDSQYLDEKIENFNKAKAIEIANRSEYGLQAAVFTENINDAFYIADKLDVGTVQVNNKTERGPDHFPFLGVKASGIGTQGIKYSIESMSRPKAVVINLIRK